MAGALYAQAGAASQTDGLTGQLLRLAFPVSATEQAPFNSRGTPAVLLSLSGERPASPHEAVSAGQITAVGESVLDSVNALDAAPTMPPPSGYLVVSGQVLPEWSLRVLVLGLILPVALCAVDGLARALRRRYPVLPGLVWVLASALAFMLAAAVVAVAHVVGALADSPAAALPSGTGAPHGAGVATLVVAALAVIVGLILLPRLSPRRRRSRPGEDAGPGEPGTGVAITLVLCAVALVMWWRNPYAALLLVPALHLWMWSTAGAVALPRPAKLAVAVLGVAAPAAAVVYYGEATALSPLGVIWNGVLMLAGGEIGTVNAVLWCVVLGCLACVVALALRPGASTAEKPAAVTVGSPLSYAGPGSLGGPGSALRR